MIYSILQISRTPVTPDAYIQFCSIPESFFATNAEYMVEETNRDEAIRQFFEAHRNIIVPREDDVLAAFEKNGLEVIARHESGGWLCVETKVKS